MTYIFFNGVGHPWNLENQNYGAIVSHLYDNFDWLIHPLSRPADVCYIGTAFSNNFCDKAQICLSNCRFEKKIWSNKNWRLTRMGWRRLPFIIFILSCKLFFNLKNALLVKLVLSFSVESAGACFHLKEWI